MLTLLFNPTNNNYFVHEPKMRVLVVYMHKL
jgi:hypothetical protein